MAYLAVTYKLLIIGILALVASKITSTYQSSTENSTTLPVSEDAFNPNSTTEENPSQTTSHYQSLENSSLLTTDTYSNVSTIQTDSSNGSTNQDNWSIPSSHTTNEMTFAKTEVQKSQTTGTQGSSVFPATSTGFTEVSSSTVSTSQQSITSPPPDADPYFELAILIILVIICLVVSIICMLCYALYRKKRRYSFDLSQKTAEDANIPLSCPILPGGFELTADKQNNKEVEKVNEEKTNHKKDSVPTLHVPEEINGKQSNHEPEVNQSPETPGQEGTDTLEDWNFKPEYASFTDINLMDCVTTE